MVAILPAVAAILHKSGEAVGAFFALMRTDSLTMFPLGSGYLKRVDLAPREGPDFRL